MLVGRVLLGAFPLGWRVSKVIDQVMNGWPILPLPNLLVHPIVTFKNDLVFLVNQGVRLEPG